MCAQTLEQIGDELIRLCSMIEKHGLVDYQMGVLEEEIIDREFAFLPGVHAHNSNSITVLLRCLHLLDPSGDRPREVAATAGALRGR